MKTLFLCLIGLAVFMGAAVCGLVAGVLMACQSVEPGSMDDGGSCPANLPRKTGYLSRGQRIFVFGFALGALASVAGAWIILKISL